MHLCWIAWGCLHSPASFVTGARPYLPTITKTIYVSNTRHLLCWAHVPRIRIDCSNILTDYCRCIVGTKELYWTLFQICTFGMTCSPLVMELLTVHWSWSTTTEMCQNGSLLSNLGSTYYFSNKPVSQSCAVAESEKLLRATGRQNGRLLH